MPNFFLNFNVLRTQAQLKGWSNRPDVPLGSSGWRRKISKTSSSKPSPPAPPTTTTTTTTTTATASSSSISATERSSSFKPTTTPTTAGSRSSVSWTGSTTNVLLIHPLCRCCTDVVNSITRPYKRRFPKVTTTTTTTTTMTNSSGSSSSSSSNTSTTTTAAGSSAIKQTWDGFPSTQYMRLWPQPDEEKLWEAKFRPERNRVATLPDPPKKKQTKKQRSWKFWPTSIL